MAVLALFTPDDDLELWRVRLFPVPLPTPVPGLDAEGECVSLRMGETAMAELDRAMIRRRAGYLKRLHPTGVMEITATTDAAAIALCEWVAALIAAKI
jgi:hypothetical protein